MNGKQWAKSTKIEKAEYLLNGNIEIKSKTGIRADARVNDPDPTVTVWIGYVGIVQITSHCNSSTEALQECLNSLRSWSDLVGEEKQ